ncbi:MAG: acetate--CoA ligase family protein, partial [Gammaproteobacteria bacterium]
FEAMIGAGFDLNLLVLDFPRTDRCPDDEWWPTLRAFQTALSSHEARGAVIASLAENLSEDHARDLMARDIVPLADFGHAMEAAEAAAWIGEAWRLPAPPALWQTSNPVGERTVLDEAESKALLAGYGVPVPAGRRVNGAESAADAAKELGFPVVVKALGVAHKTEVNAVRLGLGSAGAVREAAHDLLRVHDELLVEKLLPTAVVELLVGLTRDSQFGLVMTLASGGVYTELLRDTATVLLPATRTDIEAAVHSLRCGPLLGGFRGAAPADCTAAIDAIVAIAELARAESHHLLEMDVNPMMICAQGDGAYAADALVVMAGIWAELPRTK